VDDLCVCTPCPPIPPGDERPPGIDISLYYIL
jgi:hypothetical protein